jgi:uncharacterized protein (TIGR02300 family)
VVEAKKKMKKATTQRSTVVAKPLAPVSLGNKRTCLKCSAKFYDFNKTPIVCPKCDAEFDPQDFSPALKLQAEAKKKIEKAAAETRNDDEEVVETSDAFESTDDLGDDEEEVTNVEVDEDDDKEDT